MPYPVYRLPYAAFAFPQTMEERGFLLGVRTLRAPRAGEIVDREGGLPKLIQAIGAVALDVLLNRGVLFGRECAEEEQLVDLV
jgi:hypothetical protein